MGNRIEIMSRDSIDPSSEGLASKSPIRVYNINDDTLAAEDLAKIVNELTDPIDDIVSINAPVLNVLPTLYFISGTSQGAIVEASPKPGVNDPEGKETKKAMEMIIGRPIGDVSFAKQYVWNGELSPSTYVQLQRKLGNPLINEFRRVSYNDWKAGRSIGFHFPEISLPQVDPFSYKLISSGLTLDANASDETLQQISEERLLALNVEEMRAIANLFQDTAYVERRKAVGLDAMATDAEAEGIGQKWSEHCIHKKFKAKWIYTSEDPNDESGLPHIVDNMFKTYIVATTEQIAKEIDYLVSVFQDNSGVMSLNYKKKPVSATGGLLKYSRGSLRISDSIPLPKRYNIAHKVETHNHPSQLDPFGGADTGSGGIYRDPNSTGKSMRVVSSQYGFRTAHPNSYQDLPQDILPPAKILDGIVAGVEDYGNKMGIPTMCGNVMIDDGWIKPGVYVGAVAVAPAEINGQLTHIKDIKPGYIALTIGGKVGKDGIHGATGSSDSLGALAEQSEQINQSVQIGDPITEKGVFEVVDILRNLNYIKAIQDCGAGGWNSAVGELADLLYELEEKRYKVQSVFRQNNITVDASYEERLIAAAPVIDLDAIASPVTDLLVTEIQSGEIFAIQSNGKGGVVMDLTNVPEKYPGLAGWEKLISEAQEREVLVIAPEDLPGVVEICKHYNVEANVIAEFNDSGNYHVLDQNKTIVYLPIPFLNSALPQMTIYAHWKPCEYLEPNIPLREDLTDTFLTSIGQPNVQLYDWIITRYDHEVQGGSRIKPLVGIGKGKSDAVAYKPILDEPQIAIEACGSNPWQGQIDAYHMGRNNVVDAIGKIIAVGGNLDQIAFNGNTTCAKPEKDPAIAAQVLRMIKGAADAELVFKTPTMSGKDSTSMEREYISTKTGETVKVKAKSELLMSGLGIIPDDSTLVTCDFKLPGDIIYVVGETRDELGASEFYLMYGETGRNVPKSDLEKIKERYLSMIEATKQGLVHSAQYVSKTGLAMAIVNSSIAGDFGADINLDSIDEGLGRADKLLYSETTGRFVVTIHEANRAKFEELMKGQYVREVGRVRADTQFNVKYHGKETIRTDVDTMREKNKGEIRL